MSKRPKKTKPQPAADIETALRIVTEELLDIFSKDKLDKAVKMYREIYPVSPERHLKYFEADEVRKMSDEQLDELYSEILSDTGAHHFAGRVVDMLLDFKVNPDKAEEDDEGGYLELSAEISALAHEVEGEEFLEQARQKYGWSYEPDLFRPTKLSYKPELSPKGRELDFAVEAISLYAQYRRAFMGGSKALSFDGISETILSKVKASIKRKLGGQNPEADITELSIQFDQDADKLIQKEKEATFEKLVNRLKEEEKKKEAELKKKETEIKALEKKLKKTGKYRTGGHLIDHILKPSTEREVDTQQLQLFEGGVRKQIEKTGAKTIIEGIALSKGEVKLIETMTKMLHRQSANTSQPKEPGFYGGLTMPGGEYVITKNYAEEDVIKPTLEFTLYDIAKEFKGGSRPAGEDINTVLSIINDLHLRPYLLRYEYQIKEDKTTKKRWAEIYAPLIYVLNRGEDVIDNSNGKLISQKREMTIRLNPIFIHQIETKYVEYPENLRQRVKEAYGSHNISEITLKLIHYLARAKSSKDYKPEIRLSKLIETVAAGYLKESRKTLINKYLKKSYEVVQNIGLVNKIDLSQSAANGEKKVVFHLNKEWE